MLCSEHDAERRERDLFSHIVEHTKTVAIGPIEFAGNPAPIPNGKTMVYAALLFAARRA